MLSEYDAPIRIAQSHLVWDGSINNDHPEYVFEGEAYRRGLAYRHRRRLDGQASDIRDVFPEAAWLLLSEASARRCWCSSPPTSRCSAYTPHSPFPVDARCVLTR